MAININSNTSYNLVHDTEEESNKSVLFVKLTDSCLRALEEYLTYKAGTKANPRIRFDKTSGEINIPSKPGSASKNVWKKFSFASTTLHLGDRQGGMECVQQEQGSKKKKEMISLGAPQKKLAVMATEDVYEMTRTKMAQVDQERKEVRTKVIKINQVKGGKKKTITAPNSRLLSAVKKKVINNVTGTNSSQRLSNGTNGHSHSTKPFKQRVIQILALKPHKKLELISRLDKEGTSSKAKGALSSVLNQVAAFSDNTYCLQKAFFRDLETDSWPFYTQEEKVIAKKAMLAAGKSESREKARSLLTPSQKMAAEKSVKRSAPNPPKISVPFEKKPRISPPLQDFTHSPQPMTDDPNKSVPKSTPIPSTQLRTTNNNIISKPLKTEQDTTKQESVHDDKQKERENAPPKVISSSAETQSHLQSYTPISTYEQRCQYKQEFQSEYGLYRKLKEETDCVTRKFVELDRSWKRLKSNSKDAQKIQEEIYRLYEEHQKDTEFQKRKKQCQQLQAKLSHIKRLVVDYDNSSITNQTSS